MVNLKVKSLAKKTKKLPHVVRGVYVSRRRGQVNINRGKTSIDHSLNL
jgi:hypothetical protein